MTTPPRRVGIGLLLSSCILAILLLGPVAPASATYPGSNGEIVYNGSDGFRAIDPDGSNDRAFTSANSPQALSFSSDGSEAVFADYAKRNPRISLVDLGTDVHTVVLKASDAPTNEIFSVALSPDGSTIVFCDGFPGNLWTIATDGTGLTEIAKGYCAADWSSNGRIVASKGIFHSDGDRLITTMDADGKNRTIIATLPPEKQAWGIVYTQQPKWSPDAKTVFFSAQTTRVQPDIWSVSAHGRNLQNLTHTRGTWESGPTPSPDGTTVVYERRGRGSTLDDGDLWLIDSTGTNRRSLLSASNEVWPEAWRPI